MPDVIELIQQSMIADMQRLNTVSQNLANVNTDGYKREITVQKSFEQHLVDHNGRPLNNTANTQRDMSTGALRYTGSLHDVALTGKGFLTIQHMNGEAYTRRGELQLSADGKLTLATGEPVLGEGGPIYLEVAPFNVAGDGSVYQNEQLMGKLAIGEAVDQNSLKYLGKGIFVAEAPLPQASGDMLVKQGYLEASNVESLREMVELINTTRHF
ncbi:MAG: flagellar hook basal-body protein, partial [Pseudomonadales bacterium]|nr:flagellar hook basal-body protein [Pseudomonadales bacterium]